MLHGSQRHPLRALGALFALALFLGGTNLCMVSKLAEALGASVPMACASADMAPPVRDAAASCPMHCGHAAAPRAPRAAAPAPCCLALLPVNAPDVVAAHVGFATHVVVPVAPALVVDAMATTRVSAPADPDPPAAPPRAPLSARAPPLL